MVFLFIRLQEVPKRQKNVYENSAEIETKIDMKKGVMGILKAEKRKMGL